MSRGIGNVQRRIKHILNRSYDAGYSALRFADLRAVFIFDTGANPEQGDTLHPTFERVLKRSLKNLVDRGEVLVVQGRGGVGDPRQYVTVERFAAATGEQITDVAHAKRLVAELAEAAAGALASLRGV
jgi:hypothetical protein